MNQRKAANKRNLARNKKNYLTCLRVRAGWLPDFCVYRKRYMFLFCKRLIMSAVAVADEKVPQSRLLIPTMVVGTAAVSASITMLQLFLVDIGSTFNVSVGIASQLATVNHAGEFVFALLMSVLAVRFRHKPLILAGMFLVLFGAVGGFLAPDFITLQVFFALEGIGTVMFTVMSLTLIGDVFAPRKRAKAVSYLMAAMFGMSLVSFPLSGFIASIAGWRSNFILQTLPICLAGILLAQFIVPSKLHGQNVAVRKASYVESFRQVLTDKSATACLASQILAAAGSMTSIFGIALYRERFSVPLNSTVLIAMVSWVIFIAGSLVAGRLTNRFGAKPTTVVGTLLCGVFTVAYFSIPNLWGALVFNFLSAWFASIGVTSYTCLVLAQVPKSRGTMMSLNSAVEALGTTIGPAIGGALLVLTSGFYGTIGLALGGLFLASAVIRFSMAKDPTKT
jgi:predicted MFS family arabinose efflux permease